MGASNKILIAITGDPVDEVRQRAGDYGGLIREAIGPAWAGDYDAVDLRREALPEDVAAIVISGSSANVPNREPWMLRAEAQLRAIVHAGTPVFGICFGHQLLAQALGGEVVRSARGREVGTVTVTRRADDPLLGGDLQASFQANACHADTVARLPEGAQPLADNAHDRHQLLRFAPRCYGVQFHPEFDGAAMRAFVRARADVLRAEGLDPDEALARARDTPAARQLLRRFVRAAVVSRNV